MVHKNNLQFSPQISLQNHWNETLAHNFNVRFGFTEPNNVYTSMYI